jgi:hypothetical protein
VGGEELPVSDTRKAIWAETYLSLEVNVSENQVYVGFKV